MCVNFEEVRNILGSYDTVDEYKNGDDLSENLYRSSIGYPLRFGHDGSISYWEDINVINRVKQTCHEAIHNHGWNYQLINLDGALPFTTIQNLLLGIGGCVQPEPMLDLSTRLDLSKIRPIGG
jgi:hypothetical protein